jgi:gliding motility-associatede transport system auxiliary component
MRRLVDYLAPLGLAVLIGSLAWLRAGKTLPGGPRYYLIAGAVLVLAHLVLRWEDVVRMVGRRQMKYGGNTLVMVAVVAGILGAVNYLVYHNTARWDLTKGQRHSLSDQTLKVLQGLKQDVTITYFQRQAEMAAGQDRLALFQAASPRIKVDYVDPLASPLKAQSMEARGPWPTLVIQRGDKREKITNDSEQDVTNALIKVTRDETKTVCFVEGEGEKSLDDSSETGYSGAKGALEKSQYRTKPVVMMRESAVPSECTVLVVAGPQKDLLEPTVEAIRSWVKDGGKALVMTEPEFKEPQPHLDGLLEDWNIVPGHDVIVDVSPMGQLFGTGPLTPLAAQYPYHAITKDFRLATAFHTARSLKPGTKTVEGVSTQKLIDTSPASWAESDLTLKEPVEMDEGKDAAGPVSIGVVATLRASGPAPSPSPSPGDADAEPPPPRPEGRVVAIGDSDFATNQLLGFQGNEDFFLNTVAWLSEDADLISIRPREPDDQRLFLTRQQQQNMALLALVLLPGLFVVLGVATWWRRRG